MRSRPSISEAIFNCIVGNKSMKMGEITHRHTYVRTHRKRRYAKFFPTWNATDPPLCFEFKYSTHTSFLFPIHFFPLSLLPSSSALFPFHHHSKHIFLSESFDSQVDAGVWFFFFKLALRVLIAFRFTKESAESIFESSDVLTWRSHYFFFGLLSWKEILSLESQYECHQFDSFGLNRSDRLKSHHFEWCGCDWSSLL